MKQTTKTIRVIFILGSIVLAPFLLKAQEATRNGILRVMTSGEITILERTSSGDPGRIVTFLRTQQTVLENCDTTAVQPGAECAVTYLGSGTGNDVATRVYFYSCRERGYVLGTITSLGAATFTMRTVGLDSPFPSNAEVTVVPFPEFQAATCTNRSLAYKDLEIGRMISVYGDVDRNGRSIDAQVGTYADDCPITTSTVGPVIEKTDTSLLLRTEEYGDLRCLVPFGYDGSGLRRNDVVQVFDCKFQQLAWDDIRIGDTIRATVTVFRNEPGEVGEVVVYGGCEVDSVYIPGSLRTVVGTFEEQTDTTVSVSTSSGQFVTFAVNAKSAFVDCVGRPINASEFQKGDIVYAYGPRENGVMVARAVINASNCSSQIVDCIVESADLQTMTLRLGSGRSISVALAADADIVDCSGVSRQATDIALIEQTGRATLDLAFDPPKLRALSVNIDCPAVYYRSGVIARIEGSFLVIQTANDSIFVERARSYFMDEEGALLSWDELVVGEVVCAQVADLGGVPTYSAVTVGVSCDGETRSLVARGTVLESAPDHMSVKTASGEMSFAITNKTAVTGAATLLSIEPGTRVTVRSGEKLKSLQPIASSVAVDGSTTSVEEDDRVALDGLIAPNPAQDQITVNASSVPQQIQICAMDGSVLLVGTVTDRMDIKDLPNGAYLVVLTFSDSTRNTSLLRVLR